MSKCALGYLSVGLCSLVISAASAVSQEVDSQAIDPFDYEELRGRSPLAPGPPLPGDVLCYVTPLGGLRDWAINTQPWGINELGQVTGKSANVDGKLEAFLWDPVEGMIGLGDLPGGGFQSCGYGVNNLGHVAGYGEPEEPGIEPFFWTPEDGMIGLV